MRRAVNGAPVQNIMCKYKVIKREGGLFGGWGVMRIARLADGALGCVIYLRADVILYDRVLRRSRIF